MACHCWPVASVMTAFLPVDDRAAAAAAAKADIELRPLSDHSRRRGRLNGFVVGFAAVNACSIRDGARRLARILERQIRKAGSRSDTGSE